MNEREKLIARQCSRLIRAARKRKGLTQSEVASILGSSQANVSKLENAMLIPSAVEWFEFCSATGISPEAIRTGYIDRSSETELRSGRTEGGFQLPSHYAHERGSKVRAMVPLLGYYREKRGEKALEDFFERIKIDSDLFVDLDNQVNLNFCLDLARDLISTGNLKKQDFAALTQSVRRPETHGRMQAVYADKVSQWNLLSLLIKNSRHYEINFKYELEEDGHGHTFLLVKPAEHLKEIKYRSDDTLGDFLCQYKKHYFESFTGYGGLKLASIEERECHYHGADRCLYEIKLAG